MQDRPAVGRRDDDLGGAGGAVEEGILAGLVEVEAVMGVLERGHADAARESGAGSALVISVVLPDPLQPARPMMRMASLIAKRPACEAGRLFIQPPIAGPVIAGRLAPGLVAGRRCPAFLPRTRAGGAPWPS